MTGPRVGRAAEQPTVGQWHRWMPDSPTSPCTPGARVPTRPLPPLAPLPLCLPPSPQRLGDSMFEFPDLQEAAQLAKASEHALVQSVQGCWGARVSMAFGCARIG